MKKTIRVISFILSAFLILTLFAGCGSSPVSSSSTQAQSNAAGTTAKAPSPASKAVQPVDLTFAYWDVNTTQTFMQKEIAAFTKEYPNIKVNVQDIVAANYEDKLAVMLAGGEDLDVYGVKNGSDFAGYYAKKQLLALDDYIKKDGFDESGYAGVEDQLKVDGKSYSLPIRSDFWITYYNKDLFDKAGVSYPTNDMTWDDYRAIAKKLTSGEGGDKIYGSYFHTWNSIVTDVAITSGTGTLESGDYSFLKPAYQLILGMENDDKSAMPFSQAKTSNANYNPMFESGKVGMIVMGTWFISTLINDSASGKVTFNWGLAKAPHPAGVAAGTTVGNVTGIGINAKTKKADPAWLLTKFLCGPEGAKIVADAALFPAYKNSDILASISGTKGFPKGGDVALDATKVYPSDPLGAYGAQIGKIYDEENSLIMTGSKSVDDGLAEFSKRVKSEVLNQ